MKAHDFQSLRKGQINKPVVTVGMFDGMHAGHLKIMNALKEKAAQINGQSVVVTLWPHPRTVLLPGTEIKLLNTLDEKEELIEKAGIDHFVVVPFDIDLSRLSAHDFVKNILLDKIGMRCLVVGYDNHFGHNKEGNYEAILKIAETYGFEVIKLDAHFDNSERVSSTAIRVLLEFGDVEEASRRLGYFYKLSGEVVKGKMLGQSIGFPTANIDAPSYKMVPRVGVYAVTVNFNNKVYYGMLNIGFRPTVEKLALHKTIEVHLIDFEGDLYGKKITVNFVKRLRDELKFNSIDELKNQLNNDRKDSLEILKKTIK